MAVERQEEEEEEYWLCDNRDLTCIDLLICITSKLVLKSDFQLGACDYYQLIVLTSTDE